MRRSLLLFTILLLPACGEGPPASPEEIRAAAAAAVEERRDRLEARLNAYRAIGGAAAELPEAGLAPPRLGDRPKLRRLSSVLYSDPPPDDGRPTAYQMVPLGVLDDSVDPDSELHLSLTGWYEQVVGFLEGDYGAALDRTHVEKAREYLAGVMEEFLLPGYLLVVRTRRYVEPRIVSMGEEEEDAFGTKIVGTFSPGLFEGDALFFDVTDGEFLGAIPLRGESSSRVDAKRLKTDPKAVERDLRNAVLARLEKAMAPFLAPR